MPEASVRTPMLRTNALIPERSANSLKRTERSSRAISPVSAPAIIHPMIRIARKPMILGIAPRNRARAAATEVMTAWPQSYTAVVVISSSFRGATRRHPTRRAHCKTQNAKCVPGGHGVPQHLWRLGATAGAAPAKTVGTASSPQGKAAGCRTVRRLDQRRYSYYSWHHSCSYLPRHATVPSLAHRRKE